MDLTCPDNSVVRVDRELHFGRATPSGGLQAVAEASRKQFALTPIVGVHLAANLQSLGQNSLIIERLQGDAVWHYAELLETGDCTVVTPGSRWFIESRQASSLFVLQQRYATPTLDHAERPLKRARLDAQPLSNVSSASSQGRPLQGGFALLCAREIPSWANQGQLGASLQDLVGPGLEWALISNYMIDMPWLFSACPNLCHAKNIIVVHGEKAPGRAESISEALRECSSIGSYKLFAPFTFQFGCHHSKYMILQYPQGVRVIITTANFIYCDCNGKTQGIWWQDFPKKDESSPALSPFQGDMLEYLGCLRLPEPWCSQARLLMTTHDFSSARVALVASAPGRHSGTSVNKFGHMKVRGLLKRYQVDAKFRDAPFVAQFSSIGSLNAKWLEEFCCSFLQCSQGQAKSPAKLQAPRGDKKAGPLATEHLQIVWPTEQEVRNSTEGWLAGASIPGTVKNTCKEFLRPFWHRWGGAAAGRQRAMPHMKSYLRYLTCADSSFELPWALVTSHNLSIAAWGQLQVNNQQLSISHYELGVMILPCLEAQYLRHRHCNFSCTFPESSGQLVQPLGSPEDTVQLYARPTCPAQAVTAPDANGLDSNGIPVGSNHMYGFVQ
ncbi:hypothetical protein WJX73_004687 [Symbiochloris irregularis]|uniref:Tyrosyl-DNA phosphodiesterase 1 n=1 Tax=Symbiochloris irregularis TaxID=706552 RepID=A0AAW1PVT2_9CHLO